MLDENQNYSGYVCTKTIVSFGMLVVKTGVFKSFVESRHEVLSDCSSETT